MMVHIKNIDFTREISYKDSLRRWFDSLMYITCKLSNYQLSPSLISLIKPFKLSNYQGGLIQ